MVTASRMSWSVGATTLLVWAAAAASLAYWGMKLGAPAPTGPAVAPPARSAPQADPAAVARLLGYTPAPAAAAAAPPPMASRFSLVGVVAGRSRGGAALIAVDGRPPKPFTVGSRVEEGLVLQSVEPRRAVLAASTDGPSVLTLELPPQPR